MPNRWSVALSLALCGLLLLLASPSSAERVHTVRQGQTLAQIARRYRVEVDDLAAANRLRRTSTLRPGQELTVPSQGEIYVRQGDSLTEIAARHRVSVEDLQRTNRLRRTNLRVGQKLLLPGFSPDEQADRDWGEPRSAGVVTLVRRDERRSIALVDGDGRVRREGLRELGALMLKNEDDAVREPNPRLAALLAHLSDHFGGRAITLVSGFREAGGYTRESSRHTKGRAVDIRIQGVPHRAIWEVCRRIGHAGCGFYPRSTFVHVDARLRRTQWVDWSGPGQSPRYGTLRGPVRRRSSRSRSMPFPRLRSDLAMEITIVEPDGSLTPWTDAPEEEPQDTEVEPDAPDEAIEDDGSTTDDDTLPGGTSWLPFRLGGSRSATREEAPAAESAD
ncbi:MAG: LysM peptidoglycan-binding domain-containing protein [Sandaracinus sp.]|nr:LysM peptidoglycan-binding domain-containing protein [Sandaracinus sp.]MCB9614881.1 LysM peptidoglycan-binding domain-containing protein [Sandaracinus sp.]MCB9618633.1 LysM peptidoglycan-binding domain-containing protein [Sandaracinus sp.]MCB9632566.1 LysM peptidoglycan-binding domain-containing protein [Sandaracinus sp.]